MVLIKLLVDFLKDRRLKAVSQVIQGKLLDIGCGDNVLVRKYYPYGLGVDVFNYYGQVDLVVESSAQIPLPSESFDTVTIVAALNHIPNYPATLREARRLLKPGGRIIITMPIGFPQRLWHKIAHDYDDDQVFRGIDESAERYYIPIQEIMAALQECGFEAGQRRRFLFGLNNLIMARKAGPEAYPTEVNVARNQELLI